MHDYIVRHDHYISIDVDVTILLWYITVCVYSMYVVCVFSVTMDIAESMCSLSSLLLCSF